MLMILLVIALAAMARPLWWFARGSSITPLPVRSEFSAAIVSLALAGVVSAALLFVPVYTGEFSSGESSAKGIIIHKPVKYHRTLVEVNGASSLLPVAISTLIAGLPLLFRKSRWRALLESGAAALLIGFVILSGFSIGLFYFPSALAMLAAAFLARPASPSALIPC